MREKLVAHLKDGVVLKGHSRDFEPGGDSFHLYSLDPPIPCSHRIEIDSLKALFFVRSWGRPPGQVARRYRFPDESEEPRGRKAFIRFLDGERIWGYVPAGGDLATDFFFFPADPDDNNLKIFVVASSVEELQLLEEQVRLHH